MGSGRLVGGALAWAAVPATDPETARQKADEVLGRPEFEVQKGLIQRFFEWLGDVLDFRPPGTGGGAGGALDLGWFGSLIGWVLVFALLGLAVLLAPSPGRTAGEYSDHVAQVLPEVAAPFDDATDLFERAWYGDMPTGPDESARFQEAAGRVLAGSKP